MKKIITAVLAVTMAVGMLTGCGSGSGTGKKEASGEKLVIWTNMNVEVDTIQKYADEWGEKNGRKVEVIHQSPSVQQFAQAVKSASGPDAVVGIPNDQLADYVNADRSEKNDLTLKDFAELTDVFYIGGTKCGALFGEALIITAQDLKYRFKAYMKQNGAVLAKGWLMGLQFATMLESGEYFEAAKRADALAMQIKKAFEDKGVPFAVESFTNQQFVILTEQQKQELAQKYYFEDEGDTQRFCTSWATTEDEVDMLVTDIEKL